MRISDLSSDVCSSYLAAKADEEQIAPAVLAEGRDLAQRPRVGREILIPPRETRRREGLAGNEAREGHCPDIARNEVGEDILALQRRDRAAVDIAAGDGTPLPRAGAMTILYPRIGHDRK